MGIERFFSTVQSQDITSSCIRVINKDGKKSPPVSCSILLIDFNSIVHVASQKLLGEINRIYLAVCTGETVKSDQLERFKLKPGPKLEDLDNLFTNYHIDWLVIDKVREALRFILTQLVDPKHIHQLYLAIDGVPSRAKMEEQKKRRYIGEIVTRVKKQLLEKHKKSMGDLYLYERAKPKWSKANITPGTVFMDKLYYNLISSDTVDLVKQICPNITQYLVSGPYEPGEGEKKAVNHIYQLDPFKETVGFYSPDSDVTLLSLLLTVPRVGFRGLQRLTLIRHNQQTGGDEAIDINRLGRNIVDRVKKSWSKIRYENVINDIVFLFTLFGNDFVPRMDSINVRTDFDAIIVKYGELRLRLITPDAHSNSSSNHERLVLDRANLTKFLFNIQINEFGMLQKNYLNNNYRNFRYLMRKLELDQSTLIADSTRLFRQFRDWLDNKGELITENKQILGQLVGRLDQPKSKLRHVLTKRLRLQPVTRSIKQKFHQERLDRLKDIHQVTNYHREVYQFEQMLDHYAKMMNAQPLELGKISLDPYQLQWRPEKMGGQIGKFYRKHFNLEYRAEQIRPVVEEYLTGIFWVFDYYYNRYEANFATSESFWYYRYRRSPLLRDIVQYLQKHPQFDPQLDGYRVSRYNFFNCLEQLVYVTPTVEMIPKEYLSFVEYSNQFPNLDQKLERLVGMIDCHGAIFMSKCHLNLPKSEGLDDPSLFIQALRRIKLQDKTSFRAGNMTGNLRTFRWRYRKMVSGNQPVPSV